MVRLRKLQRKVARRKAVHQLAKELEQIANQRHDWWHKVVYQLVNSYGLIAIENLNLSFMLRNGSLSRVTHDVALGIFYQILEDKTLEAGVEVPQEHVAKVQRVWCDGEKRLACSNASMR